jgi:hypothetical protein
MTEKQCAIKFLNMILSLHDAEKVLEEGTPEAHLEGYQEALQDLAEWLADEYAMTEADLEAGGVAGEGVE